MGVVHHANYLVWFELARTRLCLEAGLHYAEIEKHGLLLLVTGAQLTYRAPAHYGETVVASCWVERLGSRAVTFAYRVARGGEAARHRLDRARLGRRGGHGARPASPTSWWRPSRPSCRPPRRGTRRSGRVAAMRRLRLTTAGESHGPGLTAILDGLPAGLRIDFERLARELARRQHGHGRGRGCRSRPTAPRSAAESAPARPSARRSRSGSRTTTGRTGNARWPRAARRSTASSPSCAGSVRPALATPTSPAARSTSAAICATCSNAPRRARARRASPPARSPGCCSPSSASRSASGVRCARTDRRRRARADLGAGRGGRRRSRRCARSTALSKPEMVALVDAAKQKGDTLGGAVTVIAARRPGRAGLARLLGSQARRSPRPGADVGPGGQGGRDRRRARRRAGLRQRRPRRHPASTSRAAASRARANRAGGLEGGITNGEDVVGDRSTRSRSRRCATGCPRSTSTRGEARSSQYERSDVTALPAAGVIGEAMLGAGARRRRAREVRRRLDGRAARPLRGEPPPRAPLAAGLIG